MALSPIAGLLLLLACQIVQPGLGRDLQGASLLPFKTEVLRKTYTIHLAHVNDVHNRIQDTNAGSVSPCDPIDEAQGKCYGGYGRLSTQAARLRANARAAGAAFYLLNAGDEFAGSLWDVLYRGWITALLQSQLPSIRPDAQAIGNHEFDYGPERLAEYIRNTTQPFVGSCNIDASAVPELASRLRRWVVLRHPTLRIVVMGWTTPDTVFMSQTGNVTIGEIVPSVRACIAALRREVRTWDLLIGLSHSGYDVDLATAAAIPELDLIVGAHTHTFLSGPAPLPIVDITRNRTDTPLGPYPTWVNVTVPGPRNTRRAKSIPVVQAYFASKYMGFLTLRVRKGEGLVSAAGGPIILGGANSSNPVAPDPRAAAVYGPFLPAVEALLTTIIGKAQVDLVGVPDIIRSQETNLGNLVADALLGYVRSLESFVADNGPQNIAIVNSGGIRNSIPAGNVSQGQVTQVLPFGNTISVIRVAGVDLKAACAWSFARYPGAGQFLQVAGLALYHNNGVFLDAFLLPDKATQLPIVPTTKYDITTFDFLRNGGDGYTMLTNGETIFPFGDPADTVTGRYIQSFGDVGVNPEVGGRIVNCATAFPPGACASADRSALAASVCCKAARFGA